MSAGTSKSPKSRAFRLSRRTLLAAGAAVGALPLGRAFAQGSSAPGSEPLRIGFLTVDTGPLAAGGKQQEEGAALFLKERNGMIAGRKVELITSDTAGNPAVALTKTQELVERHKVPVMIGPLATNEALAMDAYVRKSQVPLITTTSAATVDLKSRPANPWALHAFGTAPQVTYPLGDYAAKTLKYRRAATLAGDFTYGYEGVGGFQLAFEAAGGKVVQKLWPPLNEPDYAPYLAKLKRDIDVLYIGLAGSNPLRFLKAYQDYGLTIPVLGNTTSTDEGILQKMGDTAVGVMTAGWYAAGLQTPDNKKFVAGINALYHRDPGFYTAGPYTALLIIEAALAATNGRTDDKAAFLKALHGIQLTKGPIGPVRLDAYGTPILDIYIRKVERKNDHLYNDLVHTYPQVSQFWTFDPKKFTEQPVFSRNFPPSRYIE